MVKPPDTLIVWPVMKAGIVAGEEADRARDVLGLADALHRDGADQGGAHLLAALAFAGGGRQQGRLGRAGTDGIERDALARHLARHRLGEGDDAALARRIDRLLRGADPAGIGGDVDDAAMAARHHALQHEVAHVERAAQVDGDQLVPQLGRGVDEVDEAVPAGVVHQHVGRAHLALELGDGLADRRVVGDVDARYEGLAARLHDLVGDPVGAVAVLVEHADLAAVSGEAPADGAADRAAAAGDDDVLA